jgi:anti-sigma regulatory factor (Ser/Thr protein kinase)
MVSLGAERSRADPPGDDRVESISQSGLHHQATFYRDRASFLAATVPFLEEGLAAGEPVLVLVEARKIETLRASIGATSKRIQFTDMSAVGRNPARIIPAWRQFVEENGGGTRAVRGVGEPIWPGRSEDEIAEAQIHEELLNLAFADVPAMSLLCPYDASLLSPTVISQAKRAHPFVADGGAVRECNLYDKNSGAAVFADRALSNPPDHALEVTFDDYGLRDVRDIVQHEARIAGIDGQRAADLGLSVNELATNSVEHGGGSGILRVWQTDDVLVCEVGDKGQIDDPLIGRVAPAEHEVGGRGLYLANQLCDLVQVRSRPGRTTIRVHMEPGSQSSGVPGVTGASGRRPAP